MILFAGQSNMAERGIVSKQWEETATQLIEGAGKEYRSISDPSCLHPVEERFGIMENNPGGIYEPGKKTGSMVAAFINAYYRRSGIPVLAVSASKGGSAIEEWQGNEDYLSDAIGRLQKKKRLSEVTKIKYESIHGLVSRGNGWGSGHRTRSV